MFTWRAIIKNIDILFLKKNALRQFTAGFKDSKNSHNPYRIWSIIFIIFLAGVIVGIMGQRLLLQRSSVISEDTNSIDKVTRAVGALIDLPSDEVPALATVTDSNKLSTPFLSKAKNGDKVLIYQNNKLAVVYRPSTSKLIAVGTVVIDVPPAIQDL